MTDPARNRRQFITAVAGAGSLVLGARVARAQDDMTFPGDPPKHRLVFQFNHDDTDYQTHILNSMSALLTEYDDDIRLAVVAFSKGIHILAKQPKRPVDKTLYERVQGFAENYGVQFVACGNTMHTVGYKDGDMRSFARIEPVGIAALMAYQEQDWSYIAW
jgi:intracellular sulfur oxidation DsrE/DsrF family protein